MALSIYAAANPASAFSENGTYTNPISITVDGTLGATVTRRFYIRNDDNLKYYTNIQVMPVVSSGVNITNGTVSTFYWKLIAGEEQPLEDQWALVDSGNTIDLPNLGTLAVKDTTTYLPFWLRVNVPRGADVQVFENVALEIVAVEN